MYILLRIAKFSKKLPPPSGPHTLVTQKSGPGHKIKNLLCHGCLVCQQLSKMVSHDLVAQKTMDLLDFSKKDRVQARAYLGGTGQEYYPPKSYCRPT